MIDTDFEDKFIQACKKYGIPIPASSQMKLQQEHVVLSPEEIDYLSDKQCLIWLGTNRNGKEHGVIRDQVYLAHGRSSNVEYPLNLTFRDVYNIWESYLKGIPLSHIYAEDYSFKEDTNPRDIRWVIWTLEQGKWNYVLDYLKEDTYDFEFKKYIRR